MKLTGMHHMILMQRRSLIQLNWQKIISLMRSYFVRIIFKFRKRRLQFRQMVSILCVSVRQTNPGKTQDAFDYYVTDDGKNYGMKCFYITGGQNVEEDIYEE